MPAGSGCSSAWDFSTPRGDFIGRKKRPRARSCQPLRTRVDPSARDSQRALASAPPEGMNVMAFAIDRSLLRRALDGETRALNALVTDLRPHIERQLLRYPVADEDRRDLLQATLMQVVRRLGSFRGDSSFSTWLFRVTANEALMMMRSQRRHRTRLVEGLDFEELGALPASNDAELASRGDVGAANNERDARVRNALAELPDDYRDVVVAHYHLDLGLQEIADRFDLSESAVRSRLHRARSRLRAILEGTPLAVEAREEAHTASARRTADANDGAPGARTVPTAAASGTALENAA
jgi:RNA polymerase sigma-70 factor, ECF subfamily